MANNDVHTGYWVDHSRGSVLGATITLDTESGSLLISAATVIVNIIGVALWSIIAFWLHQHFSQPGLRDEFDAQRQIILRNTSGAETAAWSLFKNGIVWRGRRKNVIKDATLVALVPATVYALFIVAGVFVGKIATASYDTTAVLIKSGACGFIQPTAQTTSQNGFSHVNINVSTVARQYAESCYTGGGTASAISCSVYPIPRLEYTTEIEQQCPFADNACFNESLAKPITLRTTKIDSHFDLGINAPKGDRLTLEYETTCAPLQYDFVERYSNSTNTPWTAVLNVTEIQLNLGQFNNASGDGGLPLFTYRPLIRSIGFETVGYSLNSFQSIAPHDSVVSPWQPAMPFAATPGDLDILVIAPNAVTFTEPVDDVMFRTAEQPVQDVNYADAPYIPINPLYVMGCAETYQICNPVNSQCTGWHGTMAVNNLLSNATEVLNLNKEQNATYFRLASLTFDVSLFSAVNNIPNPLLASTYLSSHTGSQPLPDGFWRTEVEGWFQSALAKMQYLQTVFVNVPLGIVEANGIELQTAESISPTLAKQCTQQRVSAPTQYTNYNFFALIIIACFGIIIPAIAMTLKYFYQHLPFVDHRGHAYLSYQAEGLMQLHRMAMDGAGYGDWKLTQGDVPRTDMATERLPQIALFPHSEEGEETLRYPHAEEMKGEQGESTGSGTGYSEVAKNDPDR